MKNNTIYFSFNIVILIISFAFQACQPMMQKHRGVKLIYPNGTLGGDYLNNTMGYPNGTLGENYLNNTMGYPNGTLGGDYLKTLWVIQIVL